MGDALREQLERLADRANADAAGAYERWDGARERRQRARRVGTGVLAFAVAITGIGGAWFALGQGGEPAAQVPPPAPAAVSQGPMSVWPESPVTPSDSFTNVQRAALHEQKYAWRLDPVEVIRRFADTVLGWHPVDATRFLQNGAATSGDVYTVQPKITILMRCPAHGSCPWAPEIHVMVDQLGRTGDHGIWSIVSVTSPNLTLPVEAGDTVVAGEALDVQMRLAASQHAAIGLAYDRQALAAPGEPCVPQFEGSADVTGRSFPLVVPDPLYEEAPCAPGAAGYVFAYTTPKLTVQTGDPLVESAAISDLSIVPVRFVAASTAPPMPSEEPPPVPDAALVVCDGTTTSVETPVVQPRRDGLHLFVNNTSDRDLGIAFDGIGGDNADMGRHELVWAAIPPGELRLQCSADGASEGSWATLEVRDVAGVWSPVELDCPSGGVAGGGAVVSGDFDAAPGARGIEDPIAATRARFARDLLPGDEVAVGGYPAAETRIVTVTRDGRVVASVSYAPDGHGGWLEDAYQACDDF
jgi:hypothetical protein